MKSGLPIHSIGSRPGEILKVRHLRFYFCVLFRICSTFNFCLRRADVVSTHADVSLSFTAAVPEVPTDIAARLPTSPYYSQAASTSEVGQGSRAFGHKRQLCAAASAAASNGLSNTLNPAYHCMPCTCRSRLSMPCQKKFPVHMLAAAMGCCMECIETFQQCIRLFTVVPYTELGGQPL